MVSISAAVMPAGSTVTITSGFVFDLVYMSLLSAVVGFLLWNAMTGMETVGKLTTLVFAVPAVSILLQALETGIAPGLLSLVGAGLMFLGIYISRVKDDDVGRGNRDRPAVMGSQSIRVDTKEDSV